ncbi:O-succinylbenzoate synthase [Schumannella luteola]|uniref:o-succinylbenzoate synthase n=1 Tax=Schumannella luteola TaxID=472059 RepID=A0A852YIG5_9MICO|nr:o-succinylbenzoate synthase [Schumannella luteola]NYG97569.1 O-succinylbenzoate synthase [Schumannella luteola]TPX01582.1 O-succinylbenzoate synthase [Schumannella luteola]
MSDAVQSGPAALPAPSALPPLDELLSVARVVALPLATRFRGIDVREALLLRGPVGWTEFSPFAEYDDAEAATWLAAALDFGWSDVGAGDPDLLVLRRDRIPVNATMPAVDADRVAEVLARYDGCRTVKVKVAERGQTLADDVARVRAVRAAIGPEGRIRLDANGGWNIDEAEHAAHELAPFDLEYLEQPCATVPELAELRSRLHDWDLPIAADESVRKAEDPIAVVREGAADLVVVKAQPLGGVRAALRIVAEAGVPAVVSSALDTSVGLAMGAHLAAALPELDFDCGLGTASLLAADVTRDPLRAEGGSIPVRRVDVDAGLVDAHAAAPERDAWWRARLARCHAELERRAVAASSADTGEIAADTAEADHRGHPQRAASAEQYPRQGEGRA